MVLQISDDNRVRTLTLNRPEVLNAFNEQLYNATAIALREAAADPDVAVVLLTGAGRAFSAGNDLSEMQRRITDPAFNEQGSHFSTMIDALADFPKPLICAVNGVGVGIGATLLRRLLAECWSRNCYKVTLTSALRRVEIHGFYEALDYTVGLRQHTRAR